MESESWFLIFSLILLMFGSGYFSATETAFILVNRIRIKTMADNGDKRARHALYVIEHFDKALITLLVGNNIMNIGIASLGTLLVTRLWGAGAVAWSTFVITAVVFLACETIPKNFGSQRPETVALLLAASLHIVIILLTPLSAVFKTFADLFSRLLNGDNAPAITEDELHHIIESAADSGRMEKDRRLLLHSAVDFRDITAGEIATPLSRVVGIKAGTKPAEILDIIRNNKFTRLPVYRETPDKPDTIIGILSIRSFIKNYLSLGDAVSPAELMDKPHFVSPGKRIDELAREMSAKRIHMAVVKEKGTAGRDGSAAGIVTMEDILEELVGEIRDEDDDAAAAKEGQP
jgi:CBS domain containing-hemolysin-like protein